jgi:hypothetical protein
MKPLDERTQRALAYLAQRRAQAGPNDYMISDAAFLSALEAAQSGRHHPRVFDRATIERDLGPLEPVNTQKRK